MSGAGTIGAGLVGAGLSTPSTVGSPRNVKPPWALKLDPRTRDFLLDDDGRYVEAHPVDHAAYLALWPAAGTIAAAPTLGGPWKLLEIADADTMTRRLREYVEAAWRDLIARGDLKLVSVSARPTNSIGRARADIVWMNLRDPVDPNRSTAI